MHGTLKNVNPHHCDPPGAYVEILPHPIDTKSKALEKVMIKEHRFAFFYWYKWCSELAERHPNAKPPILITFDYHRDLAAPNTREQSELDQVSSLDLSDVALFCWARMNQLNDGHILSAAYLNIIDDIYLLKNQNNMRPDERKSEFIDKYGNRHMVYEFARLEEFQAAIIERDRDNALLDIDLDYFIEAEGEYMSRKGWEVSADEKIKSIIDPSSLLFRWLYKRIMGITIATEPRYCGGIINSFRILNVIENQLFDEEGNWR